MATSMEREAQRQGFPECFLQSSENDVDRDRQIFLQRLQGIPVNNEVLFELQRHGFTNTKQWVPDEPFHTHFRLGSQVNRYETTAAFVYTEGSVFAYEMNRLCRDKEWDLLFEHYGHCVKALWSYTQKMQAAYGREQTLYRGMSSSWSEARQKYRVGTTFVWASFTSTSNDADISHSFAHRGEGDPVMFIIETLSRGAPLLRWSDYPHEGEVLLEPFQRFKVDNVVIKNGTLWVHLSTIKPAVEMVRAQSEMLTTNVNVDSSLVERFRVVYDIPGLAYRRSRNLADRDNTLAGVGPGDIVEGVVEGDWLVTIGPGGRALFLPLTIQGETMLTPVDGGCVVT